LSCCTSELADYDDGSPGLRLRVSNGSGRKSFATSSAGNINTGCDLIERALNQVGPEGTWTEFCKTVGKVVPVGTTSSGQSFEQVRKAFFEGEGLGRRAKKR
jgi:hypothetical protein